MLKIHFKLEVDFIFFNQLTSSLLKLMNNVYMAIEHNSDKLYRYNN